MIKIYHKNQIILPLGSKQPHIFEETKRMMLNDIRSKDKIKIVDRIDEKHPITNVEFLTTIKDVDDWYKRYGF